MKWTFNLYFLKEYFSKKKISHKLESVSVDHRTHDGVCHEQCGHKVSYLRQDLIGSDAINGLEANHTHVRKPGEKEKQKYDDLCF